MKKNSNQSKRENENPSGQHQRNNRQPAGASNRNRTGSSGGNDGIDKDDQPSSDTDSSNREGNKNQDPVQYGDTHTLEKTNRGYQDMNNRSLEQDYNKNLDEDKVEHYGSESGFEEFDEYADDNDALEGLDAEYNERYNEDPQEDNELAELHTDNDVSQDLTEREISPDIPLEGPKKKRKRLPSTTIARKYGPIAQSESDSDHHDVPPKNQNKGKTKTDNRNKTGRNR